jgi:predicted DNA-binding protein
MAVSLRVPDSVKRRIAKLAQRRKTTPHALMLEAIREKLDAEEARAEFLAEAGRRLARMKKEAVGVPAGEVFEYLERRAQGMPAARPRPRKLA